MENPTKAILSMVNSMEREPTPGLMAVTIPVIMPWAIGKAKGNSSGLTAIT